MKTTARSNILLFLTAIIWGFAFVAQCVGAEHLQPFSYNGIRYALGTVSLIPVVLIFEREPFDKLKFKRTLFSGIAAGCVMFIAGSLQQFGIDITGNAGKSGFITGLYTVLVPILALIFLRKKTGVMTWVGAVFAVAGLYLLCFDGSTPVGIGDALLLIGAFFWATHILIVDRFIDRISPIKFSIVQFAVCAILGCACALIFEDITFYAVKEAAVPLLYGGLMSVGVAYTCQVLGQKGSDPTYSAIILSTESVFSAIGGALILDQHMNQNAAWGCVLMFAGIVVSQLDWKAIINKLRAKKS